MHLIYKFIDISMVILHYTMNNSIKDLLKKKAHSQYTISAPSPYPRFSGGQGWPG